MAADIDIGILKKVFRLDISHTNLVHYTLSYFRVGLVLCCVWAQEKMAGFQSIKICGKLQKVNRC